MSASFQLCVHCLPRRKVARLPSPSHSNYCGHTLIAFSTDHISTSRLRPPGFGSPNHVTQKFILGAGQVALGSFTHVAHRSAVYYLFTAYTERAFLHPFRLFKHPLRMITTTILEQRNVVLLALVME